jgi:hypothetical protein
MSICAAPVVAGLAFPASTLPVYVAWAVDVGPP